MEMESKVSHLFTLPSTIIRDNILPYLSNYEAVRLDSAITNKTYRTEFTNHITEYVGHILQYMSIDDLDLHWLIARKVQLVSLSLRLYEDFNKEQTYFDCCKDTLQSLSIECNTNLRYSNILSYTFSALERVKVSCLNRHPHSIKFRDFFQRHPGLKVINLKCRMSFERWTTIVQYCLHLEDIEYIGNISDRSIQALATNYHQLKRIRITAPTTTNATVISSLTDTSISELAINCPLLKYVCLVNMFEITDASILSLVSHCPDLHTLLLTNCKKLTDTSALHIARYCQHIHTIDVTQCPLVTTTGYLHLKTIPTLTAITMLGHYYAYHYGGARYVINPHTDETGFAILLEVIDEANNPEEYDDGDDGDDIDT